MSWSFLSRGRVVVLGCAALLPPVAAAADGADARPHGQRFAVAAVTRSAAPAKISNCACCEVVFADDFESGDTSAWSSGVPLAGAAEGAEVTPRGQRFRLVSQTVEAEPGGRRQEPR